MFRAFDVRSFQLRARNAEFSQQQSFHHPEAQIFSDHQHRCVRNRACDCSIQRHALPQRFFNTLALCNLKHHRFIGSGQLCGAFLNPLFELLMHFLKCAYRLFLFADVIKHDNARSRSARSLRKVRGCELEAPCLDGMSAL